MREGLLREDRRGRETTKGRVAAGQRDRVGQRGSEAVGRRI